MSEKGEKAMQVLHVPCLVPLFSFRSVFPLSPIRYFSSEINLRTLYSITFHKENFVHCQNDNGSEGNLIKTFSY